MEASVKKFVTIFHLPQSVLWPQVHSSHMKNISFSSKTSQASHHDGFGSNSRVLSSNSGPGWMRQFGRGPLSVALLDLNICGLKSSFEHAQHAMERLRSDNHSSY